MSKKFAEYSSFNLSEINKEILKKWDEQDVFHKSLETREGHPAFIFYEGPPSANGMPGIHHVMARSIKDIFCRYKTMKGYLVNRKAGWDTHGLPVELGVEKRLGITKEDIGKTISVEEYNAACRKDVMQFTREWEDLTRKMGYWVDMNDPYITYDNRYIESLWWLLKELYNKGLLYKGYTIQPYSPAAGTGLSTHELNMPGCYRDVKDTTCVAQFKLKALLPKSPLGDLLRSSSNERLRCLTAEPLFYSKIKELALSHRKNPTQAEEALWIQLHGKQIDGCKFRRQHIIGDFIVDFVCIDKKLVVEVDGGYHNDPDIAEYDQLRTNYLEQSGYTVIRFTNEEVLADTDSVVKKISQALAQQVPQGGFRGQEVYFLAWTTTPWTLPSNTALCVGSNITYVAVQSFNPYTGTPAIYILAKDLLNAHFNPKAAEIALEDFHQGDKLIPFKIVGECKGSDLEGAEYEQFIPWVSPYLKSPKGDLGGCAFRVITGDFVTTEDGTGIVHIAPTFGADDDRVAKTNGIPPMLLIDKDGNKRPMVDLTGKFFKIEDLDPAFVAANVNAEAYGEYAGRYVKKEYDPFYNYVSSENKSKDDLTNLLNADLAADLNVDLCVMLKQQGLAFKIEKHVHTYPHCWRTDKPVLYYPLDSWFIRSTAARDKMIELNNTINWKPASTGSGRFGKWLENLNDWNLSRSRYWGTPLPIWRTEDSSEEKCIGSVAELIAEIEKSIAAGFMAENPYKNFKPGEYTSENYAVENIDLHRPYVDDIILVSDNGKPMKREADLIDVWFDSGAMPFAQLHYPFSPLNPPQGGLKNLQEEGKLYKTAAPFNYEILKENAKKRRQQPTFAETVLWEALKGKQLENYKFRREHVIDDFIVDFVCLSEKLVIEVDGEYHDEPEVQEWDKLRENRLKQLGYRVYRFRNEEVLANVNQVVELILFALQSPLVGDLGGLYPADFISEGVDQTRGWFFTLHAISAMVKGSVAFKNVVSTGLVLDKNGNKMSKRLGNAVDPFSTIEKYGSDPVRWYMMTNASPWDNLKFDVEGIEEVRRKFFGTLYNTYSFFALYANVDKFAYSEEEIEFSQRPEIDRWIVSLLNTLSKDVDGFYADYEPTRAGRAISDFVNDHLSNWYVRLNRKRFWGGEYNNDKKSAYQTLYTCLETVARLMAPIAPFYADKLYSDLVKATGKGNSISVHLADFPVYHAELVDKNLEERMQLAQDISSMVLSLRKKENIKVRQPLSAIMLPVKDQAVRENIEAVKSLILNEVNVKNLQFVDNTSGILVKRIKPDFKKLGPKFGKIMKQLAVAVTSMSQEEIAAFEQNGSFTFDIEGQKATVELADVEVISEDIPGWLVANDGSLTVALDITITDELKKEGIAREFVNRIQNIRKSNGYEITDRIVVKIEKQVEINDAITEFSAYIATQTLANSVTLCDQPVNAVELDFEEFIVKIEVAKA